MAVWDTDVAVVGSGFGPGGGGTANIGLNPALTITAPAERAMAEQTAPG